MASLLDLFKERISIPANLQRTALKFDNGTDRAELTYQELAYAVQTVKETLLQYSGQNEVIGIYPESSLSLPAVILGILSASSAFSCIEPTNTELLKRCNIRLYWTKHSNEEISWKILLSCQICSETVHLVDTGNCVQKLANPLAYVITTSGTTGQPKVVKVPHSCIVPNILDFRKLYAIDPKDIIFAASFPTFDPFIVELFLAVTTGASLLLIPKYCIVKPNVLADILFVRNKISVMLATPTLIGRFGTSCRSLASLRILALGGEKCPAPKVLKDWLVPSHTKIFNVYGTTEVSCWATCHEIVSFDSCDEVPLGSPLSGTTIEVHDESGHCVTNGKGELWIGCDVGRICIVDDEDPVCLRKTGDIVDLCNGEAFFIGRRDSVVKRFGKQVYLKSLEEAVLALEMTDTCAVIWNDGKIFVFIVPKTRSLRVNASEVHKLLSKQLCSHLLPDTIKIIPILPMTKHGKVNKTALLSRLGDNYRCKTHFSDKNELLSKVCDIWTNYLSCPLLEDNFINCGGDSFLAVQVGNAVELLVGFTLNELVDRLLHQTFANVVEYVWHCYCTLEIDLPIKRTAESEKIVTKRLCTSSAMYTCHISWTYRLGKCVDATPLVASEIDKTSVIIGSHSHKIARIDLATGGEIWCTELANRIESSACVSACGTQIFVGCYDYCLYSICIVSGNILWKFPTNGEVKSSPIAFQMPELQNAVVFGSHDKHVYCVNSQNGQLHWKIQIGNGSIFSSPRFDPERRVILASSLDGTMGAITAVSGKLLWTVDVGKPIFTRPSFHENYIFFGCVDGKLWCYTIDGKMLWNVQVSDPIFSSPCIVSQDNELLIFFGSHDGNLYCIDAQGNIVWKFTTPSPVYGTPYAFRKNGRQYVVTCSTNGNLYILTTEGVVVTQYEFQAEVFSSPVVHGDQVVIGCRDDNVYCLQLRSKKQ